MTNTEIKEATDALISWIETQDISPPDAVLVLVHAINSIVHAIAQKQQTDVAAGLEIVANMIRKEATREL